MQRERRQKKIANNTEARMRVVEVHSTPDKNEASLVGNVKKVYTVAKLSSLEK